ncbi:unnamed protein product [Acanthoscelides obtectus]|uniref:Uncharacterized protein n=1 Tax=Acanthoscelides obtectus TaxID=200917 RepID=A0A9P0QA31_ACAOB|nr:unnamed protein product [Acanthoscelides obtectus]CAK1658842.1 hypothetical protein AOBTE_LOCUS21156 [Acanthoscelides obtectus]
MERSVAVLPGCPVTRRHSIFRFADSCGETEACNLQVLYLAAAKRYGRMNATTRVSYYIDKYGVFHRIFRNQDVPVATIPQRILKDEIPKPSATWLRLIMMFWNARVMKTAFRFGVAAIIMNHVCRKSVCQSHHRVA